MTPEEAIYVIKEYKPILGFEKYREALDTAISALKEVQQYREIGTVEQARNQKENLSIAYKIISDYESCGTVEECLEAAEKQKATPVSIGIQNFYKCPKCQTVLRITDKYCHECGQAISWGESEEE